MAVSTISQQGFSLFAARLATVLAIVCLLQGNVAHAQTAQPAPPEKVQQIIKLLDDPDIRKWLETRGPPVGRSEVPRSETLGWEKALRDHIRAMRNAFPYIPRQAAEAFRNVRLELDNHGLSALIVLFAGLLAAGFGAEWLFGRTMAIQLGRRITPANAITPGAARAARLLAEVAPLLVFSVFSLGVFLVFEWPVLVRALIATYLAAVIIFRVTIALGRVVLGVKDSFTTGKPQASLRLIPVDDAAASFWYRRLVVFAGSLIFGWATVGLLPRLGFSTDVVHLVSYLLGLGLLALAIEIVWRRPRPAGVTPWTHISNWLLTLYLIILWGVWGLGVSVLFWLGIYALLLPPALVVTGQAAAALAERRQDSTPGNPVHSILIVRGARALVILLAVLWMSVVLKLNPGTLAAESAVATQIMRGVLHGIITLLAADLLWHLAASYIDRKLALAAADDTIGAAEAARRGRLRTLLPIFRNMLAVLIAVVTTLMVLAELGVQIAPLIAGAGIFGVAIGFGSQTLVKDVISGIFYMLDDAFRVGEYIQSGSYKGTVESFSLRSVRLRHHRGPVFTVPFGELGAVQNMSRDWAIDKFLIRVPFDTDIKKVKRLVKEIGAELLADPELSSYIIETVKMKGVEQFGDFGIELSFSVMTKPGYQSYIRRRAYNMIRDSFIENGIEFAQPTVQVGADDKPSAAAAAATEIAREKAKQAVQG
ncbi:mechanosensitive ion channel family protein [Pseudaminobacter arsenicus]|uniref:Mechanosensitive ion channel family protein n=2 Tax=Borborobacter arsenicus TaxID=1851146 RepID=A0A432V0P5_9HYPH|nr:mechanosensitive ion channel family protein [Pseudaminobacter arsenicus]